VTVKAIASLKAPLAYRDMTDRELDAAIAREWGKTLDASQRELEDAMAEHMGGCFKIHTDLLLLAYLAA